MTTLDEKGKSADELIVEDLKLRSLLIPNPTEVFIASLMYTLGPFLSVFSIPVDVLIFLFGRNRKIFMLDASRASAYQLIGMGINLIVWILWSIILGWLLVIFGSDAQHLGGMKWLLVFLAIIPAVVGLLWLGYAVIVATHPKRLEKTKIILYPKITELVDNAIHNKRLQQFQRDHDYKGEGAYLFSMSSANISFFNRYDLAQKYAVLAKRVYQINNDNIRELGALELLFIVHTQMKNPLLIIDTLGEFASKCKIAGQDKKYREVFGEIVELTNGESKNPDFLEKLNLMMLEKPNDPIVCFCRANIYESRNDYDAAYDDASRGLSLSPDDPDLLSLLAIILYDQERFQAAIEIFTKVIEIKPDWAYIYRYRAESYLELQNVADATIDIDEAIKLGSRKAKTRAAQALLFLSQKEYSKAEHYFQIAMNQEDSVRWKFGLALSKLGQGDSSSAYRVFLDNHNTAEISDLKFIKRWLNRIDAQFDKNDESYGTLQSMIDKFITETVDTTNK